MRRLLFYHLQIGPLKLLHSNDNFGADGLTGLPDTYTFTTRSRPTAVHCSGFYLSDRPFISDVPIRDQIQIF